MQTITLDGSTQRTQDFLKAMQNPNALYSDLAALAQQGVIALAQATPVDSGLTAASWSYVIEIKGSKCTIAWVNSHRNGTANVAILLQYGHGTGTGGYVQGRDYINPALKPIFDQIADSVWEKVRSA